MATSHRHAPGRLLRLVGLTAVLSCLSTGLGVGVTAAAPSPSIADVQRQIDALNGKVERFAEAFDAARIALDATGRAVAAEAGALARAGRVQRAARLRLEQFAVAAYEGGGPDALLSALTSSDPAQFLRRAVAIDQVSRAELAALQGYLGVQHRLTAVSDALRARLAAQRRSEAQIAADRATIERVLAEEQATLARLTAVQRAALTAAQNRAAVAARASRSAFRPALAPTVAGDGRAQQAVSFAFAQLGKPYQWGGAGPGAYDCSGLTMASWAAAGVSLPHNAAGQQASVPAVAMSDLRPGDLVFFGSPAYHVGIYVGNGMFIHAPHTGTVVTEQSLASMPDFAGAGRP